MIFYITGSQKKLGYIYLETGWNKLSAKIRSKRQRRSLYNDKRVIHQVDIAVANI